LEGFVGKKIYVGNLPFSATNESLTELFSSFGKVDSSKIVTDRDTGRSKGFGFVEMSDSSEADAAIEKLNGSDLGGRSLTVNEARPMEPRTGGFGGGRGGDRGGDRGGRGGFGGGRGGDRGGDRGGNRW
jgi:RNA recognition motif-containing protein